MSHTLTRDRADRARVAGDPAVTTAVGGRRETAGPGPLFAINGRFYGQALTGVQRYGHEIVQALDHALVRRDRTAELRLPRGVEGPSGLRAVATRPWALLRDHAWEQAELPLGSRPLLNLCNTGPIARACQVVCIHDTNVFTEPGSYRSGFRLFYRTLQPLLARRGAVIATVSQASADAVAAALSVDRRRIAVLPNGHEHALAWRRDEEALRRNGIARPFVLLLGSRARHKNARLLFGLAPALDELGLDLVVAGGGGAVFATEIDGPPRGNVRVLGSVSDGELAALLGDALCLAFPSWTEGFGLPVVEAMARGCPVVSSDRASLPEVCGPAALMAAPDDPRAWLAHIAALARAPQLRRELAERGLVQARRYSWAASAAGYLDLMEALA